MPSMLVILLPCILLSCASGYLLPPSFRHGDIRSNTFDDLAKATTLFELDAFIEVVLIGNFSQSDQSTIADILDYNSIHSDINPLRDHVYEKKIYRVTRTSAVLWQAVVAAVESNSPRRLSETLESYHSKSGASTTLFLIGIAEKKPWTILPEVSNCIYPLNMRGAGAAWFFLDIDSFTSDHISFLTLPKYFDLSNGYAFEIANTIKVVSGLLIPFPNVINSIDSKSKDLFIVEISICGSYVRIDGCPEDSLVANAIRAIERLYGNAVLSMKVLSVSFNFHDHPDLLYALHASTYYDPSSRKGNLLDMHILLRYLTNSKAIRRSLSGAVDIEGRNRNSESFEILPIFNVQLPSYLNYSALNVNIASYDLPFWESDDSSQDYPMPDGRIARAIVRLKSQDDSVTINDDNFKKLSLLCSENVDIRYWNGFVLFDHIVEAIWGVTLKHDDHYYELTRELTSFSGTVLALDGDIEHDFRRARFVVRAILTDRFENSLKELVSLIVSYGMIGLDGLPIKYTSGAGGDVNLLFAGRAATLEWGDDLDELASRDWNDVDAMEIFMYIVTYLDKASQEFSHLSYHTASNHLNCVNLFLKLLRRSYENAVSASTVRYQIEYHWNNNKSEKHSLPSEQGYLAAGFGRLLVPNRLSIYAGIFMGCFSFVVVRVFCLFRTDGLVIRPQPDPFKRHKHRGRNSI